MLIQGRWRIVLSSAPEIEAKRYEGKIKSGNLLLSVHTENADEVKRAEQIFKAARAEDICSTGESSVPKARENRTVS